ncbi:hypothetical protein ABEB36_007812 [Hypothenemus hampei]|uniref:LNR domain-containing protein n=1 Tax=Hypothenemus hampei TaxID=57062 RepID=A0ABD1EVF4_HYPHA
MFRHLKGFNGNTLILFALVSFLMFIYFCTRIRELKHAQGNCIYQEPIDVVYTWVNGSDYNLIQDMRDYLSSTDNVDSSKKRYDDKNELRFSLRSLEKFAPWINHVYLVTNGQIPYWLNLDCEKLTVITHDLIFKNKNNLPTFSSPAIESNLHRIPGLSKRFIYFNDDIFLGQPIYLDDFYSLSKGYSIPLAYVLPNCADNCPWLYVGDGQCDISCNNEKCQFDGGDCGKDRGLVIYQPETFDFDESTESYSEKVNKEIETLKEKVQMLIDYQKHPVHLNKSINAAKDNSKSLETATFKVNETFSLKHPKKSISQFVKDHNKGIIMRNKKLKRKRRNESKKYSNYNTVKTDGFLESLQYTQKVLNKKYGFKSRYVPAHAPIFLDTDILQQLENTFPTEFVITERNRFRHYDDMQFGFSYYYHLMSETEERTSESIFEEFDSDGSRTWSDREIRNLLTKIYELPLSYEIVDHFEEFLVNCSELKKYPGHVTPPYERYIDSKLPTITKDMVVNCKYLTEFLKKKLGPIPKYKYHIFKNAEKSLTTFKMLISNVSDVVINLDEIRRTLRKFICLNDDLEDWKVNENDLIRAILYDFYLSLFPHPSQFELPENSRNRFLHISTLNEWKRRHCIVKFILLLAIASLIVVTCFNPFKKGCCIIFNELFCK